MKTVFLMISRLLYDKGYTEYVETARIIRARHPDTEFQLLGNIDPSYPKAVPETVVKQDCANGTIVYLGYVPDVIPLIRKADCIVHPSYYEGLSRVLMEALAMGKPIIASDIPGCRETVEHGKNGFLIPPQDIPELVDTVSKFLSLDSAARKQMGYYGRIKAEREFDVKNVISVYRKITDAFYNGHHIE